MDSDPRRRCVGLAGCSSPIVCGLIAIVSVPLLGCGGLSARPPAPHIVILLADDLGWADVGFHGSAIPTPHLDRLARSGARLEQFYVQPLCAPTRAGLLTGRYPIRYGLQDGARDLSLRERTLAEALGEAGYRTALVGKWDLGFQQPEQRPTRRGFDHQYGHYHASISYFARTYQGGLDWHRQDRPLLEEGYSTTLIGAEAVRLIEAHDATVPLFLLVAFNAPHAPLAAPEDCKSRMGHAPANRRLYGAVVACMDDEIGRILEALERRAMRERTLVLFASDNGGTPTWGASNEPLRGGKLSAYEGGVRAVALASWPGVLAPGSVVKTPIHVVDLYPTLLGLAGASLDQPLPVDGVDVWPTLAHGAPRPRSEILIDANPRRIALRKDDWKLVFVFGGDPTSHRVELFDVAADPFETTNLASLEPQVVFELLERARVHRAAAVPPLPRPEFPRDAAPPVWGDGEPPTPARVEPAR